MDDRLIEEISRQIERHIGPVADVFHELIPEHPHIDIHIVHPNAKRPYYTLVTSGMSESPMAIPKEMKGKVTPFAELMLCLPKDWNLDDLDNEKWAWPINWLRFLASYPHKFDTWLYVSHTIPNSEDCNPFSSETDQCCWFVRVPQTVPEAFCELKYKNRVIAFHGLTAIYKSEMEFALSQDFDSLFALDQALSAAGVTELVNPKRPPLTLAQMRAHLGKV